MLMKTMMKWNPSSPQFVVYGSYFFLIGAVFMARAVFHMTRVGWHRSWQQRYIEIEDQSVSVLTNMNEGASTENDGEPVGVNNDVLTDEPEVMENSQN